MPDELRNHHSGKYAPVEFKNIYLEREDVIKHPFTKMVEIGTEIKYQKAPNVHDLSELACSTTKFIGGRTEKLADNFSFRTYQGLRAIVFFASAFANA